MLEYFTYQKYKKHKAEKEEEDRMAVDDDKASKDGKGKGKAVATDADTATSPRASSELVVLEKDEQSFLERLTASWSHSDAAEEATGAAEDERPPLPPRVPTPELTWDSDSESFVREDKSEHGGGGDAKDGDAKDGNAKGSSDNGHDAGDKNKDKVGMGRRLSVLLKRGKKKGGGEAKAGEHLAVPGQADSSSSSNSSNNNNNNSDANGISVAEEQREGADLARVLGQLDLVVRPAAAEESGGEEADTAGSAGGPTTTKTKPNASFASKAKAKWTAVALSAESADLVRRFVVVLQDLVRGVPTAADDLRHLLDDRDGTLARGYERLPSSLRKLVAQLPSKMTSSLAPELLAAAAASQGVEYETAGGGGKQAIKDAAKTLALPAITNPKSIVTMLKAIVNALKLRWPAFIGTNALWSVALFLLLFVLWYCHKRGREVRMEKEAATAAETPGAGAEAGAETETLPTPPVAITIAEQDAPALPPRPVE